MIIVEFCGLPGAGKTTLCDKVESECAALGYSVKNLHTRKAADSLAKKVKKAVLRNKYTNWQGNREFKSLLDSFSSGYTDDRTAAWIDRLLEMNYLIHNSNDLDIALFDEGFIQLISSICFDKPVKTNDSLFECVQNIISEFDYVIVNCQIPVKESYDRVIKRNRLNDRYVGKYDEVTALYTMKDNNVRAIFDVIKPSKKHVVSNDAHEIDYFIQMLLSDIRGTDHE